MPASPRRPGDQSYDGLIISADLPDGWHLASRFPGERDDDASEQIDAILGYNDQAMTDADRQAQLDSEADETVDGRWRYIEHSATATRVLIRLQRQTFAVPEEVRITGVIYLPWRPGDPITSQLLRELPTARIEASINKRLFAMTRTETITGGKIVLPSGRKVSERDLLKPLGDPKKTPDFYERRRTVHRAGLGHARPRSWAAPARTPGPRRIGGSRLSASPVSDIYSYVLT